MDFLKGAAAKASDTVGGAVSGATEQLDPAKVTAGLKEALNVATKKAVEMTSVAGGFNGNAAIRVLAPPEMETMTDVLRKLPGFSAQVEDFEKTMNRAAEMAAKEAMDIFGAAVAGMSIDKALEILKGHVTAATEYFSGATRGPLHGKFLPIVTDKMNGLGLVEIYETLVAAFAAIPLVGGEAPKLNLPEYVTTKALDGLFKIVADKETEIRSHPAARVTPLLAEVFA
jgi:hypothetical protein